MSSRLQELETRLQAAIGATMHGLAPVVRALTVAVVARGHVLLQGAPGLGKTLLSKSVAGAVGGRFKRIQGTPDLMPADIIGVHTWDAQAQSFTFRQGPLFTDLLLFDEINRTGPKTQSALLEAMEERQVTVDNANYPLPAGFLVVATQNPREFEGTYPLPESQLDRFMMRIDLTYPTPEDEVAVLQHYGHGSSAATVPGQVVTPEQIAAARAESDGIHVSPELARYVVDLARATREHAQLTLGLSTRGALALLRVARITAGLNGAAFATADDVQAVLGWVVPHRLMLSPDAIMEGVSERDVLASVLERVPVPR